MRRDRRRQVLLGALVAVVLALAATVGMVLTSDDGDATRSTTAQEPVDEPAAEALNPSQAFATALRQIEEGGSFRYSGAVHADEATVLRPTTVFPEPVEVEGEVDLPHRVHEIASDGSDRVVETTIVGPGIWERTSSAEAGPAAAPPYAPGRRGALGMGAALLPTWLRTATDRAPADAAVASRLGAENGTRTFRGRLPLAEVTGPVEIAIGLDGDGVLTHVWIADVDAPFFVDWEIDGIGDPIEIAAPADELVDAAVDVDGDDLAAAGITRPLHLTDVPAGWVLAGASIEPDAPSGGCSTLHLNYQPVDELMLPDQGTSLEHVDVHLQLDVMATPCAPTEPLGDPFAAGGLTGEATDSQDNWYGRTTGRLSDGVTTVRFESVLPLSAVEVLLGSLAPFDPEVQPTEVDGLG